MYEKWAVQDGARAKDLKKWACEENGKAVALTCMAAFSAVLLMSLKWASFQPADVRLVRTGLQERLLPVEDVHRDEQVVDPRARQNKDWRKKLDFLDSLVLALLLVYFGHFYFSHTISNAWTPIDVKHAVLQWEAQAIGSLVFVRFACVGLWTAADLHPVYAHAEFAISQACRWILWEWLLDVLQVINLTASFGALASFIQWTSDE
eukprot:3409594-Amphidinium_carterae.1